MDTMFFYTDNFYTFAGAAAVLVLAAGSFLRFQNTNLRTSRYTYSSPALPAGFCGFRLRQVSDYHNTARLENRVINRIQAEKPDIIVITGDLIDCRKPDVPAGISLAEKLVKIAPVYMVCGNHEAKLADPKKVKKQLAAAGVNIIENRKITLHRGGDSITLRGLADPQSMAKETHSETDSRKQSYRGYVLDFMKDTPGFSLVLAHRPEFIHTYRDSGINLALAGHAHGGQFGIPFTDIGVFVPNQGLFPAWAAGYKTLDDTTMIISRGIGNSVFPFRLFNYPEIVTVEFE